MDYLNNETITAPQANAAIMKAHSIQSSASNIDNAVSLQEKILRYDINRGSVTILGKVVTLGVGMYYLKDLSGVEKSYNVITPETYTIEHNNSLVFNKINNNFIVTSNSNVSAENDITLLNYDNVAGMGGGIWYKHILKNTINSFKVGLFCVSRASVSISTNKITIGTGNLYILYSNNTMKGIGHSEKEYTLASGSILVYSFSSNSISVKTMAESSTDDSVLFWYDGAKGVQAGLLMPQYLNKSIEDLKNTQENATVTKNLLNANVKAVCHRGYSSTAPENTLPAYKLAKDKGFSYVEADIGWTSDNVPVMIHDTTVNRTSNGTGNVESFALADIKLLDFGSWKNSNYADTRIPTFREFMLYCKQLNLHPYVEPKAGLSAERANILVDIVKKTGMIDNITWISFDSASLSLILARVPKARVGYLTSVLSSIAIAQAVALSNDTNDVFISPAASSITLSLAEEALTADIPIECWTVDTPSAVLPLVNLGVTGITTNSLNIQLILNS